MNRLMASIAMLGWAVLASATATARADDAAAPATDGWTIQVNFVGGRSSAVSFNYRVDGRDTSGKSAIILLETLKRKMAEQGFEQRNADDGLQEAIHGYAVYIVGDALYSTASLRVERRGGHLMAVVVENNRYAVINGIPAEGRGLAYRQLERMADAVIALLTAHSFI